MRICHVITRLIIGGAQENTILTCAGLQARGHEVTLLVGPEAGPEGSLLDEARSHSFDVRLVRSLRRAIRPLSDLRAHQELAAVFHELRPDVVHTHSSKAGVIGRLAARQAGVPIIVHTIHGMSFNRTQAWYLQSLYRWLERYCARCTNRILCVADAMSAQSIEAGIASPEKFVTVYSGMRTDWYDPSRYDRRRVRQSWGVEDDSAVVVGTVARLFENKGYEQLLPAMAEAARRVPALRFVWVGDGAQRSDYEEELEFQGIRSRVHLTGLISPEQVAEQLAGMDLLVHASQWEGLPRAVVQAFLMQCPVISFDIDGAPEVVVPDETGMLVPLNDSRSLAETMVRMAGDHELRLRLGRAGRDRCLKQFDHDVMVKKIEQIYKELADHCG